MAWIAFYLMGEDMELSCDESVIREMGYGIKGLFQFFIIIIRWEKDNRRVTYPIWREQYKGRIKNILYYKT